MIFEQEADTVNGRPVLGSRHLALSRLCGRFGRWGERGYARLPLKGCAEGAEGVTVLPDFPKDWSMEAPWVILGYNRVRFQMVKDTRELFLIGITISWYCILCTPRDL